MKLYTVLFHNEDGDAFNIGVFSTFELAEEECKIFATGCEYTEHDRDTFSEEETRIYYENEYHEPSGMADISMLTLDEFTY